MIVKFNYYDPLSGKLPDRHDFKFIELVTRARRLLVGRSIDEINLIAKIISKLESNPNYRNPLFDELAQPTVKTVIDGEEVELIVSSNEVEAVFKNVSNINLAEYSELKNIKWYELFSVITLSYAEQVSNAIHQQESWRPLVNNNQIEARNIPNPVPKITDQRIDQFVDECLILARQSVNFAEMLKAQDQLVRTQRTRESSNAAKIRHAENSGPLKDIVIEKSKNYSKLTNRNTAKKIFTELQCDGSLKYDELTGRVNFSGKFSLQNDDPIKRFEIWIGNFRKVK